MWIRSQDARLIIDADKLLAREVLGILGKYEIINIGENTNYRLGIYSSLKKAGKVMDRIHYNLNNPEETGTTVFQMPADENI